MLIIMHFRKFFWILGNTYICFGKNFSFIYSRNFEITYAYICFLQILHCQSSQTFSMLIVCYLENKGLSCVGNVLLQNKNRLLLQQLGQQKVWNTLILISKKFQIKHIASQWVISRALREIHFSFLHIKPIAVFRGEYRWTADSRAAILKITWLYVPLLRRNCFTSQHC